MSDPENSTTSFLRRWSRRKRAVEHRAPATDPDSNTAAPSNTTVPSFDPAVLPPIESIGGASDIHAYLAPNVPIELRRAALRRLWLSDPAIRDFIGIPENQWDFTKPDSVPGFGSLELTPELRRLAEEFFGSPDESLQTCRRVRRKMQPSADRTRPLWTTTKLNLRWNWTATRTPFRASSATR